VEISYAIKGAHRVIFTRLTHLQGGVHM